MKGKLNITDHLKLKKDKPKKSNWLKDTLRQYELEHLELCKWLKDMDVVSDMYVRSWPNTDQFLEENKKLLQFYYIYDNLKQKTNESKERTSSPANDIG